MNIDDAVFVSSLDESIIAEAESLVNGARQEYYGHPFDNMTRTAKTWEAILGIPITAEQVALCMIGVKLSRHAYRPQRDNLVDIAGYAEVYRQVVMERARREKEQEPDLPKAPYYQFDDGSNWPPTEEEYASRYPGPERS